MSSQINNLTPKFSFILGLIGGFLIASFIGFIILIIVFLSGGRSPVDLVEKGPTGGTPPVVDDSQRPSKPASREISMRPISDDDHIRGDKNAPVTIVEYSDLECPFCKRFHPTLVRLINEYEGQVKWVYRHFPLTSLHPKAPKEAEATECANELGGNDKFWAYIDRLYEVTPSNNRLELSELPQIAQDVGLDRQQFEECLNSGKYAQYVQTDYQDAVTAGGTGTPYSVIIDADGNKIPVSGAVPYEQLKQVIDSLL